LAEVFAESATLDLTVRQEMNRSRPIGSNRPSPAEPSLTDVVRRRGARPRRANCDHVVGLTRSRRALKELAALYDDANLRSTIDGVVSKVLVSPGSVVRPGEPMIEIVGKHRFVVARFPVSRLYCLQVGDAVTVSTGGARLPGKIVKVSIIADALPKEFQKALAPVNGTRQIASVRPAQGFTAGAQVVGKAVSGRCFAFWNAVLSAEAQGTCH